MKLKKQKKNELVFLIFGIFKSFKVIFTNFFVQTKIEKFSFLRGEPSFFKKKLIFVCQVTNMLWCYGNPPYGHKFSRMYGSDREIYRCERSS